MIIYNRVHGTSKQWTHYKFNSSVLSSVEKLSSFRGSHSDTIERVIFLGHRQSNVFLERSINKYYVPTLHGGSIVYTYI